MVSRLLSIAILLHLTLIAANAHALERAERPVARSAPALVTAQATPASVFVERPKARPSRLILSGTERLARRLATGTAKGLRAAALVDVATGELLEFAGSERPLPTASVTKLVTTAFALDRLGPDYRFTTRILGSGDVINGILQGDLVLAGGGDPSLDTDELAEMIDTLRARGIRGIGGRFLYDASRLPPRRALELGQPPHVAYNPGLSGLNLNFNRVYLEWTAGGGNLSLSARAETYAPPARRMVARLRGGAERPFTYSEANGMAIWDLAPGALRKAGGRWLPVRSPARYAADVFRDVAISKGLILPIAEVGRATEGFRELARHTRRPLRLVCRGMLHFSTNLTAEVVGLTASGAMNENVSATRMTDWAKTRFGVTGVNFADHAGLDDDTRTTAQAMAQIIAGIARDGQSDGIVRRYYAGNNAPPGEIRAKTGTLNFVRGLGGIVTTDRGRKLAFAIFSADLDARARADHRQERVPGAQTFATRAIRLEKAILRDWMARY